MLSSKQMKKRTLLRMLFIALFLLVLWRIPGVYGALEHSVLVAVSPFLKTQNYISERFDEYAAFLQSKQTLSLENKNLRRKISEMNQRLLKARLLEQENQQLKEFIDRKDTPDGAIFATVLVRPNRLPYDTLLLNRGASDEIEVGSVVLAGEGTPIGVVRTITQNTSRVVLFSASGESSEVVIGKRNTPALARGVGSGNFKIRLPRNVSISGGDIVQFSNFPGRVAGVVEKVDQKPSDPFQVILFKLPVNIFELRFVSIIAESLQE